jgi:nitrilase
MSLHVVGVQIKVKSAISTEETAQNLSHARGLITEHHNKNNHNRVIYVLPECSTTGYSDATFEKRNIFAEKPEKGFPSFDIFSTLCAELSIFISYGFIRLGEDKSYFVSQAVINSNTLELEFLTILDEGKLVSLYDKVHLFSFEEGREGEFFKNGALDQTKHVFDCYGFKCASQICFDLRFPEPWRVLAYDHGCDFVIHTSFDENSLQWNTFALTRALENQYYLLSLNHAGKGLGKSLFCPPWLNDKLHTKSTGEEECFIEYNLEKSVIEETRSDIPLRPSRRLF